MDYYKLLDKYNRLKRKYKEDIPKLQKEVKKSTEMVNKLQGIIDEIKEEDHYYQIWLEERDKLIKQFNENTKLLEEIANLKEKLALTIKDGTLLLKIKKEGKNLQH